MFWLLCGHMLTDLKTHGWSVQAWDAVLTHKLNLLFLLSSTMTDSENGFLSLSHTPVFGITACRNESGGRS